MNLLLDTQAVLWISSEDHKLGKDAASAYSSAERVFYSSISMFELNLKQMLGRIKIDENITELLQENGMIELGFSSQDSFELARFGSLISHDPFDRMLLCQAVRNGFYFLTADKKLLSLKLPWIIDASK